MEALTRITPGSQKVKIEFYRKDNKFLGVHKGLNRQELVSNTHFRVLFISGISLNVSSIFPSKFQIYWQFFEHFRCQKVLFMKFAKNTGKLILWLWKPKSSSGESYLEALRLCNSQPKKELRALSRICSLRKPWATLNAFSLTFTKARRAEHHWSWTTKKRLCKS